MLRAAHQIDAPVQFQLLTRKTYAQWERPIISFPSRTQAIRGNPANGLTHKDSLRSPDAVLNLSIGGFGREVQAKRRAPQRTIQPRKAMISVTVFAEFTARLEP